MKHETYESGEDAGCQTNVVFSTVTGETVLSVDPKESRDANPM